MSLDAECEGQHSQNGGPRVIELQYRDAKVPRPRRFIILSYTIACTASLTPCSELNPVRNMSKGHYRSDKY